MKFLLDVSPAQLEKRIKSPLVLGQLLTPLTSYANAGGMFAIDNGAFVRFDRKAFLSLIHRNEENMKKCFFVVCPDIPGNARRTLELFRHREDFISIRHNIALVAQDGLEDFDIPWNTVDCLFVGGFDPWKDSTACMYIVRTAKCFGKHVHVGRVNTISRYRRFAESARAGTASARLRCQPARNSFVNTSW